MQLIFITLSLFVTLLACSKQSPSGQAEPSKPKTFSLSGVEFLPLLGSELVESGGMLQGSGRLVALRPAPNQDYHYAFKFQFGGEGSSLTLVTQAGADLQNSGPQLRFKRVSEKLEVFLLDGSRSDNLSPHFAFVGTNDPIDLGIDVHGHGDVIIWVNSRRTEEDYGFGRRSSGQNWGLIVDRVNLSSAAISGPKAPH